jgi:Flp pilus assembly protein TadD
MTAEAVIAESVGDRGRALAALDRAQERQPDEWTVYYLEARVLSATDPRRAGRALARARALNPRGPEIAALEQQLR